MYIFTNYRIRLSIYYKFLFDLLLSMKNITTLNKLIEKKAQIKFGFINIFSSMATKPVTIRWIRTGS